MPKIIKSPLNDDTLNPRVVSRQESRDWFGKNFDTGLTDLESCVRFDRLQLEKMVSDQNIDNIVLSKIKDGGKTTLAIAGIDISTNLQDDVNHSFLLGNEFKLMNPRKKIDLSAITLSMGALNDPERKIDYKFDIGTTNYKTIKTIFNRNKELGQKTNANYFLTVKFPVSSFAAFFSASEVRQIAFLPFFMETIAKQTLPDQLGFAVEENSTLFLETLVAFPISKDNKILSDSIPPVISTRPWPINYPPFN